MRGLRSSIWTMTRRGTWLLAWHCLTRPDGRYGFAPATPGATSVSAANAATASSFTRWRRKRALRVVLEHFRLARRKARLARGAECDACERGIDVVLARANRVERVREVAERGILEDESVCAGVEDDSDDALVRVCGVDRDQHLRRLLSQLSEELGALEMRHAVVDQRDVRLHL